MELFPDRRQFLQLTGTTAALSIAGCNSSPDDSQASATETNDNTVTTATTTSETATEPQQSATQTTQTTDGRPTVTLIVQIDQKELEKQRNKLQKAIRNGTINQSQARRQYQLFRTDLITAAVQRFRQRVKSDDTITIEDTVAPFGVLLISGSPAALIETIAYEEVRSLTDQATFARTKARAEST